MVALPAERFLLTLKFELLIDSSGKLNSQTHLFNELP